MLHIPILRHGVPYESVEQIELLHHATGEPVAKVSMANAGLVGRDIRRMDDGVLEQFTVKQLMDFTRKAGKHFMESALPLGDATQTFDDYVKQLSATTGMPQSLCRGNAGKIFRIFDEIDVVVAGLTRGFDLTILDRGWGDDEGRTLSYFREGRIFGAVLPSNSPGVHSLWIPAVTLKAPIALKPGREEPWSPFRIIQAFIAAGLPKEAFGFYPTDHGGAGELLREVDRSMLFGDAGTTKRYAHDPRVELHGPGYSKVILGPDAADNWEKYVDVITQSISANGGRSCINASAVWTPKNADKIAKAVAERLATWQALPADHPDAKLALFANPAMPERINMMIDANLPGARDLTQEIRGTPRLVKQGRCTWLLPTILRAERDHALAGKEFLFPFATVIESPMEEIPEAIGDTLVGTVITDDRKLQRKFMACRHIDRLNLGPVPTFKLSWDQPHEGNLFEHLYRQRAFQAEGVAQEEVATGVMP
ncbi:MAG TPA: aldehyde dehydrogenase family protein [Tepidisphaeraceae bacterium]|nr:aldehyde dehydrogenase family protein [Tepidisphaeraceae bacterium]